MKVRRFLQGRDSLLISAQLLLLLIVPAHVSLMQSASAEAFQSEELLSSGARIEVQFIDGVPQLGKQIICSWIERCAKAVATYYGRMPVKRLRVKVHNSGGEEIGFATAGMERGVAEIEIPVGVNTPKRCLDEDWILTHEMVHLGFPIVAWKDRWLTEGMATYIEPLARLQIGNIDEKEVWTDLIRNTPKGQPRRENEILSGSRRIDRIYWGGAIFCLVADVEIRKKSKNRVGLQDVLRYIPRNGANIYSDDEPRDALAVPLKSPELKASAELLLNLYDRYNSIAVRPNLDELFSYLGVSLLPSGRVYLENRAPGASIRKAINNLGIN